MGGVRRRTPRVSRSGNRSFRKSTRAPGSGRIREKKRHGTRIHHHPRPRAVAPPVFRKPPHDLPVLIQQRHNHLAVPAHFKSQARRPAPPPHPDARVSVLPVLDPLGGPAVPSKQGNLRITTVRPWMDTCGRVSAPNRTRQGTTVPIPPIPKDPLVRPSSSTSSNNRSLPTPPPPTRLSLIDS